MTVPPLVRIHCPQSLSYLLLFKLTAYLRSPPLFGKPLALAGAILAHSEEKCVGMTRLRVRSHLVWRVEDTIPHCDLVPGPMAVLANSNAVLLHTIEITDRQE